MTLSCLKSLYDPDDLLQGRLPTALLFCDHIWWWKVEVYVPLSMREFILKRTHDIPSAGHWGLMKTLDLLTQTLIGKILV